VIDKCTHAAGHVTAAQIDRVNHLEITGIVFFKQRDQLAGVDGILDVEQSTCHSNLGQRDLPHGLAIIDLKIAPDGLFHRAAFVPERPAEA
jgi:hypothetical protein